MTGDSAVVALGDLLVPVCDRIVAAAPWVMICDSVVLWIFPSVVIGDEHNETSSSLGSGGFGDGVFMPMACSGLVLQDSRAIIGDEVAVRLSWAMTVNGVIVIC